MCDMSDSWYRQKATEKYHRDGEIEVDEGATVSVSEDAGAYVQAWVWVADPLQDTGTKTST